MVNSPLKQAIKTYTYACHLASTGEKIGDKKRYEFADGTKTFLYQGLGGSSGLPDEVHERDLHMYGWDEIGDSEKVVIVEGEKVRDTLRDKGIVAVSPMTQGNMCNEAYEPLMGKVVVLWADNDATGEKRAATVIEGLQSLGYDRIAVVEWKDAPEKSDAVDAIEMGVDVRVLIDGATPVPIPPAIDLASLLETTLQHFEDYVLLTQSQAVTLALWCAHTHVYSLFYCSPYLHIFSPQKRSGKTRTLEVCEQIVSNPWLVDGGTTAAFIRKINAASPTLLLDESDATFKGDKERAETIRGVLNSGFKRGGSYSICVPPNWDVVDFSTYCPKALAGIGRKALPDTVKDRSIPIELKRKLNNEPVKELLEDEKESTFASTRYSLLQWACQPSIEGELRGARPTFPEDLNDRQKDIWKVLLAIADLAGGRWPQIARLAAQELSANPVGHEDNKEIKFLADTQAVFDVEYMPTSELITRLCQLDESPWATYNRGKPITAKQTADIARGFNIYSKLKGTARRKSYVKDDFADAWSRYLPPLPLTLSFSGVTAVEGREGQPTEQPGLSPLNGVVQAKGEVERQRELEMDEYYASKPKEDVAEREWEI